MTITIRQDDGLAERVLELLRIDNEIRNESRGKEIHVSDVLFPRRTWYGKHHPKPTTDDDLLYFTAGRAHHEIFETLISEGMREVRVEYDGVVGSLDVLDEDNIPVEIKTTRTRIEYAPVTIPRSFVAQLGCYAAMLNQDDMVGTGKLLIFYMVGVKDHRHVWRKLPKLASFDVDFDNLAKTRAFISRRRLLLEGNVIPPTETCYSQLCIFCKWYGDPCGGWGSDLEYRIEVSEAKCQ